MKTKTFDAVEMKRRGQQALREKLQGLTLEQEMEFWRQRTEELLDRQRKVRAQRQETEAFA
jgi:hypothetical protein